MNTCIFVAGVVYAAVSEVLGAGRLPGAGVAAGCIAAMAVPKADGTARPPPVQCVHEYDPIYCTQAFGKSETCFTVRFKAQMLLD